MTKRFEIVVETDDTESFVKVVMEGHPPTEKAESIDTYSVYVITLMKTVERLQHFIDEAQASQKCIQ